MTFLTKLAFAFSLFSGLPALAQSDTALVMMCLDKKPSSFTHMSRTYLLSFTNDDAAQPRDIEMKVFWDDQFLDTVQGTLTSDSSTGILSFKFPTNSNLEFTIMPTSRRRKYQDYKFIVGQATIDNNDFDCLFKANLESFTIQQEAQK